MNKALNSRGGKSSRKWIKSTFYAAATHICNLWSYLICCNNQKPKHQKHSSPNGLRWNVKPKTKSNVKTMRSVYLCCVTGITLNWSKSIAWPMTTRLQSRSKCSMDCQFWRTSWIVAIRSKCSQYYRLTVHPGVNNDGRMNRQGFKSLD